MCYNELYINVFEGLYPEAVTLRHVPGDRKVYRIDNRIYKVFESDIDLNNEWKAVKHCNNIYPTRYGTEVKINRDNKYLSFPKFLSIKRVTKQVIADVKLQLEALNAKGWMHLDVSFDNIIYDPTSKQHYLIDYGLATTYEHIIELMRRNPEWKPYKDIYRDPKGFNKNSDMYALSILEKMIDL